MKKLIYAIYIVFFCLMAFTFYKAFSVNDGLIEESYYKRSKEYFLDRKAEEILGFMATLNDSFTVGKNTVSVKLAIEDSPLQNANVILSIGNVSTTRYDSVYSMSERYPGSYTADAELPVIGRWIVKLDIEHPAIRTHRTWDIKIER